MNEDTQTTIGGLPRTTLDGAGVTNVDAVIGHLYTKPSTVESSTELQITGINGTASKNAKGPVLSASSLLGDQKVLKPKTVSLKTSNLVGIFDKNESNLGELVTPSSEAPIANLELICKRRGSISGHSAKRKSEPVVSKSDATSKRSQLDKSQKELSFISQAISEFDKANKSKKRSSQNHGLKVKKKEKKKDYKTVESLGSSSSSAGESGDESSSSETSSSTATSETSSVESEGDEGDLKKKKEEAEEANRQLQIAQLKEKRKELRKEVRKLKHANQEAATTKQHNKSDQSMTLPKTIATQPANTNNNVVVVSNNNKSITANLVSGTSYPSLVHSTVSAKPSTPSVLSPILPVATQPSVKKTATMQQETTDSSMPLDLCVKKTDSASPATNYDSQPLSLTMYDSGSAVASTPSLQRTTSSSLGLGLPKTNQMNLSGLGSAPQKRRGRKPKALPSAIPTNHLDDAVHRHANDVFLNSSSTVNSSRAESFDLSALDISNLSSLSSRGTSHQQLILPSPFSTIEGLKIPDVSNRVSSASASSTNNSGGGNVRKRRCKVMPSRIVDYKDANASKNSVGNDRTPTEKMANSSAGAAHQPVAGHSRKLNQFVDHNDVVNSDDNRKVDGDRIADSYSSSDSESSLDSGSESNSTDNTERSLPASTTSSTHTSTGLKRHRSDRSESRSKKKKLLPDDKEIRIPLEYGWRRQTRIRCISRSGVKGDVLYYSPCGKKLRSFPEVIKYLQKNGINDVTQENISFSPKVIVGEFTERLPGNGPESTIMLSEQEVAARIEELKARKRLHNAQLASNAISKLTSISMNSTPSAAHSSLTQAQNAAKKDAAESEEKQRKWEEIQMQRRIEQQAIARQNQKLRAMRRTEQNNSVKETKRRKVEDIRRQKEQQRMVKQQEKMDKMEQQRMEKELRNQQLLEELQKRREMLLMVDLERERRRQHMMLVRALETRKKIEERDKKTKEIFQEKEIQRLKKMEQRRLEMQLIREIKKPVDDMMLKDAMPLPTLNRIPGLKISSKAFGDLLMVFEFLHNFGETLGFDMENLPMLSTLQLALLNYDEKNEEELLSVVHHLLVCAIDDPGVSHPRSALTVLGQTLREVDITSSNVSEVLRLYVNAVDRRCEIAQWLSEKPFLSLNPTKKAAVLAFLCHELLGSKIVTRQVEMSIDSVNNLKKEKWIVEGQLRRLRGIQQRRKAQAQLAQMNESTPKDGNTPDDTNAEENDGLSTPSGRSKNVKKNPVLLKDPEDDDELDDVVIDSGNESDETQETGQPSEAEDDEPEVSNEELDKKIEKLQRQQNQFQNKLQKTSNTLRATTMGQDRYRRRYWILPKAGGIFVESLESSEILRTEVFPLETMEMRVEEEARLELEKEKEEKEAKRKAEDEKLTPPKQEPVIVKEEKVEPEVKEIEKEENEVPEEEKVDKEDISESIPKSKRQKMEDKVEKKDLVDASVKVEENLIKDEQETVKEKVKEVVKDEKPDVSVENNKKENKVPPVKSETPIIQPDQKDANNELDQMPGDDKNNWLLHSPLFASILTGSLLMNSPLMHGREINGSYIGGIHAPIKGASTSTPSHAAAAAAAAAAATSEATFNPFMGLPPDFITAEQIMKHFTDSGQSQPPQRNWFSILPKIPCDESSLTLLPGQKIKSATLPSCPTPSTSTVPSAAETKQAVPSTSSRSKHSGQSSKNNNSTTTAPGLEGALKNMGPLGIFPPEVTNKITASALANLQLGLLNGIPPNILMHSFMAAHGIGPLYQSGGNNSPMTPEQTPALAALPSASNEENILTLEKPPECSTPNSIQMEADLATTQLDHPKRAMVERMQFDIPKPIPLEMQHGWWRITDISQLKQLFDALHHRGIREKILHKHLEKHYSYATSVCITNQMDVTDLEITDLDREISTKLGAAPDPDTVDYWLPDVALRVDLAILEQVENLEDKIAGASMQIKQDLLNHPEQGWKVPPKLTSEKAHLFKPACTFLPKLPKEKEKGGKSVSAKAAAAAAAATAKQEEEELAAKALREAEIIAEENEKVVIKNGEDDTIDAEGDQEEDNDESSVKESDRNENDIDDEMELDLEDEEENYEARAPLNPVEVAQTRLLKVESVIERRYIRPPLGTSTELNLSAGTSSQQSYCSDEITPGLIKWRRAVQNCVTSAQLALCINMLENCIAWDKSIMRASCQFCHSGDNEEMLLLCDGCDKGYHTYCFKPKMETIPDGDWYCYECLNKATGDKVCIMCGKKGNKMLECEGCPKTFHMSCLEPPVSKAPKGKWSCPNCSHKSPIKKSSGSSKSKSKSEKEKKEINVDKESAKKLSSNGSDSSASTSAASSSMPSSKSSNSKEKKEKSSKAQGNKDLAPCKIIIEELECHEDAWPFLLPVNVKQFPTYRKVIKKFMDLSTMKSKLEAGIYKVREEFIADARLIFDNCETFNEDDSPVGIAGHNMRAFFECRWSELCGS